MPKQVPEYSYDSYKPVDTLPRGTRFIKIKGGKHIYYYEARNIYFAIYRAGGMFSKLWRVDQYPMGCDIC